MFNRSLGFQVETRERKLSEVSCRQLSTRDEQALRVSAYVPHFSINLGHSETRTKDEPLCVHVYKVLYLLGTDARIAIPERLSCSR